METNAQNNHKINLATIGTNFIVEKFINTAKDCPQININLIYSREITRAIQLGSNCSINSFTPCDSIDELAKTPDTDVVYIASPTFLHCSQTIKMLSARKNVLCEKPAASNLREWNEMVKTASDNNVLLLEAMRPIFTPGFHVIKNNLKKVGTIRKVFIQYCQYSSRYGKFKNGIIENAFRPELSNGALMDLGIYCIEVLVGLFGAPLNVTGKSVILPDSIDGEGTIIAEYPQMQAVIVYSKISDSGLSCEIQGEDGCISFNDIGCPKNVIFTPRKGEPEVLFNEPEQKDMYYEINDFIHMLSNKKEAAIYNSITCESLKITDEIRKQCNIVFPADNT